ncbi:MAG TPA: MBL fold metallo-hydrolase, partial [Dehalococcoidia bacterium]|nr:MBL fold metallo-hydrolase [Dehalococcoidia bacterium]
MKGDRSAQLRILTIPLDYNKVYALVGEDGLVLIDSGPDFVGAWDEIVGALRRAGFEAKHVQSVLLTHAHPDHSSLAARWQHDVGAEIVAPRGEEPALLLGPEFVPSQREVVRGFL